MRRSLISTILLLALSLGATVGAVAHEHAFEAARHEYVCAIDHHQRRTESGEASLLARHDGRHLHACVACKLHGQRCPSAAAPRSTAGPVPERPLAVAVPAEPVPPECARAHGSRGPPLS